MERALDALFGVECGELDIGKRAGWTAYIDFIRPEELGDASVVKGTDASGRRFIAFKSAVATERGPRRLFTTLFQRYADDPTLYHTAGHYGTHLFTTTGGASLAQIERVRDLVKTGRVDLTVEEMKDLRVGYRDYDEIERLDATAIDAVTLG
jgi:hypothetical protein